MFEEFFQKYEIRDPEKITAEQSDKINTALQKKLAADNSQPQHSDKEKEKDTMKIKSIRTVIIAAAVAVVGLGAAVAAAGNLLTREEMAADLAEKNGFTPEFAKLVEQMEPLNKPNELDHKYIVVPSYEDMVISELAVREVTDRDLKGWEEKDFPAIILQHLQPGGGMEVLITSDGNGGYQYDYTGEPTTITDEKLLAAIAEGTEKYGDTFVIMY